MIATWMLYGTAVALLVGLGAAALERGARVLGRAGRWCWIGAMVVTLALPVVAWYRPRVLQPLPITMRAPTGTVEGAPPVAITAPTLRSSLGHPWTWSDFDRPLIIGWGLLSLGLLSWFTAGSVRLARMRRAWRSQDGYLISVDVGPAVVGFFDCQIVVPQWSLDLTASQRDLLHAHEAEHLTAHDSRFLLLSAAVVALAPWNIALWWQFRRLRLAIELDCDQRVLRRRPDPATYGRLLIEVGSRAARTLVPVAAFREPRSSLEHRIRALTALRPRRAGLWAAGAAAVSGMAIFAACEAPRPTAPTRNEPFSYQVKQEDGRIQSTYIADSVRYYFPQGVQGPSYIWFVLSPDLHVIRHGLTPRSALEHVIRSQAVAAVIPDFLYPETQSVTIVGENAMSAGSQPVYWAVLRDPSKPATWLPPEVDSLALLPWVREGLLKWWGPLLAQEVGDPTEVWFIADMHHRIFMTYASQPSLQSGQDVGALVRRQYPGLRNDMIYGFSTGGAHGWARRNVQIVWVTLRDSPATAQWFASLRQLPPGSAGTTWIWNAEPLDTMSQLPSRGAIMEKGEVVVGMYYPKYLKERADPPITVWVVEGPDGRIRSVHTSKAYEQIGNGEIAAELPAYSQFHPGEWMSWLPFNQERNDIRIVWVHSNRAN